MNLSNFLSSKERAIHRKAHQEIDKLFSSIESGKLRSSGFKAYDVAKLSGTYFRYYQDLKAESAKSGLINTHSMITMLALELLKRESPASMSQPFIQSSQKLIDSSTGPDEHFKTMALMMEGHFYGIVKNDPLEMGNYMARVFSDDFLKVVDYFNDIDETALSNFSGYLNKYKKTGSIESLAWSLHYIQDITAPHHAGNYAMFFSKKSDGFDTHHGFEKKAMELINDSAIHEQYINDSVPLYNDLKSRYTGGSPESFASFIHNKSIDNITPAIREKNEELWIPVINSALPLAIAATAAVLS